LSFINVNFYELHSSFVLFGQLIQNWFKSSAVSSPGCRKINENRAIEFNYFVSKGAIRDIDCSIRITKAEVEPCFALTTYSIARYAVARNPVLCTASTTTDNKIFLIHHGHLSLGFYYTLHKNNICLQTVYFKAFMGMALTFLYCQCNATTGN